ncbi:MAG: hypothetical protein ACI855_004291, partial [Myxococcota bacterium]
MLATKSGTALTASGVSKKAVLNTGHRLKGAAGDSSLEAISFHPTPLDRKQYSGIAGVRPDVRSELAH